MFHDKFDVSAPFHCISASLIRVDVTTHCFRTCATIFNKGETSCFHQMATACHLRFVLIDRRYCRQKPGQMVKTVSVDVIKSQCSQTQTSFFIDGSTEESDHKDQLSLTNPRDALHHGERAANK